MATPIFAVSKATYVPDVADVDMLPMAEHEQVEILEQSDGGWWLAKNSHNKEGWVPSNFLHLVSASATAVAIASTPTFTPVLATETSTAAGTTAAARAGMHGRGRHATAAAAPASRRAATPPGTDR